MEASDFNDAYSKGNLFILFRILLFLIIYYKDLNIVNSKYVHALKQIQLNRIRKEIELHQKIHDLQFEFEANLNEFDKKRAKIISGEYVPSESECKYELADPSFSEPTQSEEHGIPQFWSTIFHNLDILNDMIGEKDEPILNHLVDLRYILIKEPRVSVKLYYNLN